MINRILLRPNFDKPATPDCTRHVVEVLRALGLSPLMDAAAAAAAGVAGTCETAPYKALLLDCDLVLVIGGDGTILHAVRECVPLNKPLLGVNTGRRGFLTQLETTELDKLALLRDRKYSLRERMLLEATLDTPDGPRVHLALNDFVLFRGDSMRLVELDIAGAEGPVARYRADGVIFATPTGSTAYSLAAGGPIADPALDLILMTAVCPHAHLYHSMLLSTSGRYRVRELPGNNTQGIALSADGERVGNLAAGESVVIAKSQQRALFLDFGLWDFYRRVDQKLALEGRIL